MSLLVRRVPRLALAFAFALGLAGCGGGGGSSPAPTVRGASGSSTSAPAASSSPTTTGATPTPTASGATATPTAPGATATPTAPGATATPTTPGATPTPKPTPTTPGATPTPKPTPTTPGATPTPTPTPVPVPAATFNDNVTYGHDNQRDIFNPNSSAITTATLANLHVAWQNDFLVYATQGQPIMATEVPGHAGVLYAGGWDGKMRAFDALTGHQLWATATGQATYTCGSGSSGQFGIGGSPVYDPANDSLYVVGNTNVSSNAPLVNTLYQLDPASGNILNSVNFAPNPLTTDLDFSHTSVMVENGMAYVGTGATCDISSWRGRVAQIAVPSMTLNATFFTEWDQPQAPGGAQPYPGGGVWGWGGVSADFGGNILTGVGNADQGSTEHGGISAPFTPAPTEYTGFGDSLLELSSNLQTVMADNQPIPTSVFGSTTQAGDLDVSGTPIVFQPIGCDPEVGIQSKSGAFYLYDETNIANGPLASYQLSPPSYSDGFLGSPTYSPLTGLLYVNVASTTDSIDPPGMIAINPGCGNPSIAWTAQFGPDSYPAGIPRSAPTVTAGGVVLVGTVCTPDGNGSCVGGPTTSIARKRAAATTRLRHQICCAPPGNDRGAVWALDAVTGTVLNGGDPILYTNATLRAPPLVDGNWVFVLDGTGSFYGLTIDPSYPAITTKSAPQQPIRIWEDRPRP